MSCFVRRNQLKMTTRLYSFLVEIVSDLNNHKHIQELVVLSLCLFECARKKKIEIGYEIRCYFLPPPFCNTSD